MSLRRVFSLNPVIRKNHLAMNLALVKGNHLIRFQIDPATHGVLVLVKGNRQIGSQVNSTIHGF